MRDPLIFDATLVLFYLAGVFLVYVRQPRFLITHMPHLYFVEAMQRRLVNRHCVVETK